MTCSQCPGTDLVGKDGLCRVCRARRLGKSHSQYVFTDVLRDKLRGAYRQRRAKRAAILDQLVTQTGWPRAVFYREATRLGCVRERHQTWTPTEDAILRDRAGAVELRSLALRLGRSQWSVRARIYALDLSLRGEADGYTSADLAGALGVCESKVRSWMRRGMLGRVSDHGGAWRVEDRAVERFLRQHPREYDLRLVDQVWFKSVVFGAVAA